MFQKYFHIFLITSVSIYALILLLTRSDDFKANESEIIDPVVCGRYPKEQHITTDNIVWQILQLPIGFVKILNAYADMRHNLSIVRVNVNSVPLNYSLHSIFCQFWFEDKALPYVAKASEFMLLWYEGWGWWPNNQIPYFINCPFDFNGTMPVSVSLVAKPCDHAENLMHIINPQPVNGTKKRFAVCSKQISYTDRNFGIKFIEWTHLMRILGAEKVFFFNRYLHPDIFKVVQYYESRDIIETWPFLEPSGISDNDPRSWQAFLLEMNMLNDCFYRIKNLYDFVAVIDFDEVIMPVMQEDMSWEDIAARMIPQYPACQDGYNSENVYYPHLGNPPFDGVPSYLYMLQHVQRSVNFSTQGEATKTLMGTDRGKLVHNHYLLECINPEYNSWCNVCGMPKNISQVSHYRHEMEQASFNITFEDKTIWKFKDRLIADVQQTLDDTGFKP